MGGGAKKKHESFTVTPASAMELGATAPAMAAVMAPVEGSPAVLDTAPTAAAGALGEDLTVGVEGESVGAQLETALEAMAADPPALLPEDAAGSTSASSPDPLPVPPPAAAAGVAADLTSVEDLDVLTPIPEASPPGHPLGVPVLLAGQDLEDGTASLVSYQGPSGPQELLVAHVAPEAEGKLLEALDVADKMVPVQVEKEVIDSLPSDTYHAKLKQHAKAINTYLKHGTGDPAAAASQLAEVRAAIEQRLAEPDVPDAEKAMLTSYKEQIQAYQAAAAGPSTKQKLPKILQHKGPVTKTVTDLVPEASTGEGLPTVKRDVSRVAASIAPDGTASWDGVARKRTSTGSEYAIDLGDGYQAVYRPYGENEGSSAQYSMRGALEVTAPPEGGHGRELVRRLEQLHLVAQPMTAAEGEAAYLRANIAAQGLEKHPAVAEALAPRPDLEQLAQYEVFGERAHEVIGLSPDQTARLSRELVLQAERRVAAARLGELRDAVAAATGHASGAELAASPGYDPSPQRSGGWHAWRRFDVAGKRVELRKAFGSRCLSHTLSGSTSAVDLIRNGGVLASTERRRLMGIQPGVGLSESADQSTGGARSVFLRVGGKRSGGDVLEWHDPTVLLSRADWYAYSGDHFGAVNPKCHQYSESSLTRDPFTVAGHKGPSNEVMFRHGIDLLGPEAPSRIRCSSTTRRDETLAALAARGVTHIHGKPVEEVVVCT